MALFKRKRQYQDQQLQSEQTATLTSRDGGSDSLNTSKNGFNNSELDRKNKRMKTSHEELSNNIVFEDDLLDGYGDDLYGDENDRR